MVSSEAAAIVVADSVGVRPVATAAELRTIVAPLDFCWVDVFAGDQALRTQMLTALGLEAADVSWALRFGQVPRMAIAHQGIRVVTSLARAPEQIAEVHLLCSGRRVLTVWNGDPSALDQARRHFLDRAVELEKNHFLAAAIVLQLLLATLDQAITVLDSKLHSAHEQLRRVTDGSAFAGLTDQLQSLQSRWADFDRYSSAVRAAIVGVEAVPGMDARGAAELDDYAEQVEDTEHRLRDRSQWASSILQDHLAAVANRQADQINRLTLVSLIFLPITFITGFFGMNFGWMAQNIGSTAAFVVGGVVLPLLSVALTIGWIRRRGLM